MIVISFPESAPRTARITTRHGDLYLELGENTAAGFSLTGWCRVPDEATATEAGALWCADPVGCYESPVWQRLLKAFGGVR